MINHDLVRIKSVLFAVKPMLIREIEDLQHRVPPCRKKVPKATLKKKFVSCPVGAREMASREAKKSFFFRLICFCIGKILKKRENSP